ncbi:MAG: hypothetical protein KatS3mg023_1990 [Armatimonadota bacterium]|nr:MAG: hypothetical protein KatS3mg023_1990 [Armatimonadota bacterium]
MTYTEALKAAHELLREWRELLANEARLLATGDERTVLRVLTNKHSLPHRAVEAIRQAATAAAQWYAQLAQAEEQRIARLDAELQPLLDELRQLQQRVDELVRRRRGHEHRLTALKSYAHDASSLTSLSPDRVQTPQDAETWLAKLPPCEEPPAAEPFQRMTER